MRTVVQFLLSAVLLVAVVISCTKEEHTTVTPSSDYSYLSGGWSGNITILQMGDCTVNSVDSVVWPVNMELVVTKGGAVTATENYLQSEWIGTTNGSTITFEKGYTFIRGQTMAYSSCADSIVVDTAAYSGTISITADPAYRLEMNGFENWCPTSNCTYELRYSVTQD